MSTELEEGVVDTAPNGSTAKGAFSETLYRNFRQIKTDRATAYIEDAQMLYHREIQDMTVQLKRLKREQESAYDISPTSRDSLKPQTFDPKEFVMNDVKLTKDIINLQKHIDACMVRYEYLFGLKFVG